MPPNNWKQCCLDQPGLRHDKTSGFVICECGEWLRFATQWVTHPGRDPIAFRHMSRQSDGEHPPLCRGCALEQLDTILRETVDMLGITLPQPLPVAIALPPPSLQPN